MLKTDEITMAIDIRTEFRVKWLNMANGDDHKILFHQTQDATYVAVTYMASGERTVDAVNVEALRAIVAMADKLPKLPVPK